MAAYLPYESQLDPVLDTQDYFKQYQPLPNTSINQGMPPSPYDTGDYGRLYNEVSPSEFESIGMPNYQPVADPSAGATESKVAKTLGAVSGIAAWAPGVGSLISGLSAAGSLIMNWWAADKQMKAQKEAQKQAQAAYAEQMAESKRRYDIETGLKREEMKAQAEQRLVGTNLATRQLAHTEKMDEETLKANKEQKYWDRWLSLMQNMTNMMSTTGTRAGVAQLYKR